MKSKYSSTTIVPVSYVNITTRDVFTWTDSTVFHDSRPGLRQNVRPPDTVRRCRPPSLREEKGVSYNRVVPDAGGPCRRIPRRTRERVFVHWTRPVEPTLPLTVVGNTSSRGVGAQPQVHRYVGSERRQGNGTQTKGGEETWWTGRGPQEGGCELVRERVRRVRYLLGKCPVL